MSLRSVQLVRSVTLLTVRKEAESVRSVNIVSLSTLRIFLGVARNVLRGV